MWPENQRCLRCWASLLPATAVMLPLLWPLSLVGLCDVCRDRLVWQQCSKLNLFVQWLAALRGHFPLPSWWWLSGSATRVCLIGRPVLEPVILSGKCDRLIARPFKCLFHRSKVAFHFTSVEETLKRSGDQPVKLVSSHFGPGALHSSVLLK